MELCGGWQPLGAPCGRWSPGPLQSGWSNSVPTPSFARRASAATPSPRRPKAREGCRGGRRSCRKTSLKGARFPWGLCARFALWSS
eukprot:2682388-Alexandrium_andersonii.AAC.1